MIVFFFASISCVVDTTCTVTGPTVINVHSQLNFIKDRCAYSLVSIPSIPNLYLVANFRDRRREDVSLLDSVILRLDGPGVHIHLEQGGRVWVSCLRQAKGTSLTILPCTLLQPFPDSQWCSWQLTNGHNNSVDCWSVVQV